MINTVLYVFVSVIAVKLHRIGVSICMYKYIVYNLHKYITIISVYNPHVIKGRFFLFIKIKRVIYCYNNANVLQETLQLLQL